MMKTKRRHGILWILCFTAAILLSMQDSFAGTISLYPFRVSSESGRYQFGLSGRAILEGFFPGQEGSGLIREGGSFLSGRASLFPDVFLGSHLYATAELRMDTGEAPRKNVLTGRVEQAFLRYTPSLRGNLHFQYGKFVSPFGAYSQRHDTAADPFIRPPLMYDHRTMVSTTFVPRSNDGFIRWKYTPSIWRPRGAPVIWGNPYQVGFMVFGGARSWDFRFAVMNSSPSSEPGMWNGQIGRKIHPSYVVHVGYRIRQEFYVGMAYNSGPYLHENLKETVGEDEFNSYTQQTWEVEFLFERGKTQVRGEAFHDTWKVERVMDDAVDISGYVEIKQKFLAGLYGALRFGTIRHNEIRRSSGIKEAWDFDTSRWQAALGYRLMRNLEVRGEAMWNRMDGPLDPRDNLFSLQCRIDF